jgi:hypothetical protein
VRFSLLFASSALAASLALSACSNPASQFAPGGSQSVAPMAAGASAQLVVSGAQRDAASCPSSKYFACVTVAKGKTKLQICISTSGNCTSGLTGSWNWKGKIVSAKTGKPYKGIKATFKPNPGNPTEDTFSAKKVKNSHGKIVYAQNISACNVSVPTSCLSGAIGIATK